MKKINKISIVMLGIVFILGMIGHAEAATEPDLNTASGFGVMAGGAVSDTATPSDITGSVGLSPTGGSSITQLSCTDVAGVIYDTNSGYTGGYDANTDCLITNATLLTGVKADISSAYNDAKNQVTTTTVTASTTDSFAGTGYTLSPGVYESPSTMGVPVNLTLDAEGDDNAVFIFKAGTSLNTVSGSTITLINGARAENIFWQVGSSATLGTGSVFEGTIMAAVSITDNGTSSVNGRLLADADNTDADSTGAVSLNDTTIVVPTSLTVVKEVVNDDGGAAVASDFTVRVKDGTVEVAESPQPGETDPGTIYELNPGSYVVSEDADAGYNATIGGDCIADGTVTLDAGDTLTCTITNDDIVPKLTVNKVVINDDGGSKVISDFSLFVDGDSVESGVANTTAVGTHTVSETPDSGYETVIGGDCAADGTVSLAVGDIKTCTVTNDDIASTSGGGDSSPAAPVISVVKVPEPLALPDGPGTVEYTYTVHNIGTMEMTDVTLAGDTCSPITRVSNGDDVLNVNEKWVYTCSTTLTETHTNIVTATGWANGISATDVATATVVVGVPTVPPLINVTKVPDPLALSSGGGEVTYTFKVTNPGEVALSNVSLTDDKCSSMLYISGDTNANSELETTETWEYTCTTDLIKTTVNTAAASGDANGLTAKDFAIATVIVSDAVPKLPTTGFAPGDNNIPWNIIVPAGILAILASLYFARRKQTT